MRIAVKYEFYTDLFNYYIYLYKRYKGVWEILDLYILVDTHKNNVLTYTDISELVRIYIYRHIQLKQLIIQKNKSVQINDKYPVLYYDINNFNSLIPMIKCLDDEIKIFTEML